MKQDQWSKALWKSVHVIKNIFWKEKEKMKEKTFFEKY